MVKCKLRWSATFCFILVLYFKTCHDAMSASGIKRFYVNKIELTTPFDAPYVVRLRLNSVSVYFCITVINAFNPPENCSIFRLPSIAKNNSYIPHILKFILLPS